jgi:hypothetical protein
MQQIPISHITLCHVPGFHHPDKQDTCVNEVISASPDKRDKYVHEVISEKPAETISNVLKAQKITSDLLQGA